MYKGFIYFILSIVLTKSSIVTDDSEKKDKENDILAKTLLNEAVGALSSDVVLESTPIHETRISLEALLAKKDEISHYQSVRDNVETNPKNVAMVKSNQTNALNEQYNNTYNTSKETALGKNETELSNIKTISYIEKLENENKILKLENIQLKNNSRAQEPNNTFLNTTNQLFRNTTEENKGVVTLNSSSPIEQRKYFPKYKENSNDKTIKLVGPLENTTHANNDDITLINSSSVVQGNVTSVNNNLKENSTEVARDIVHPTAYNSAKADLHAPRLDRDIKGRCNVFKKCPDDQYCDGMWCYKCRDAGDLCDLNGECCEGAECQYGSCTKGVKAGDPGTFCDLSKDCKGEDVCCIHELSISKIHSICKPMLNEHESCGPINLFHQDVMKANLEPICGPCKKGLSCKGVGILGRHSICLPNDEE